MDLCRPWSCSSSPPPPLPVYSSWLSPATTFNKHASEWTAAAQRGIRSRWPHTDLQMFDVVLKKRHLNVIICHISTFICRYTVLLVHLLYDSQGYLRSNVMEAVAAAHLSS